MNAYQTWLRLYSWEYEYKYPTMLYTNIQLIHDDPLIYKSNYL